MYDEDNLNSNNSNVVQLNNHNEHLIVPVPSVVLMLDADPMVVSKSVDAKTHDVRLGQTIKVTVTAVEQTYIYIFVEGKMTPSPVDPSAAAAKDVPTDQDGKDGDDQQPVDTKSMATDATNNNNNNDNNTNGAPPSLCNVLLLYLSLLGLGVIGGYGSFYYMFAERCTGLMAQVESRHGEYRASMQVKYEDALEQQRQCLADTTVREQLHQLQGRLEAQSNLAQRHQSLLQQQQDTLQRLSNLQHAHETATHNVVTLREELAQTRLQLERTNRDYHNLLRDKETTEKQLHDRLSLTESVLTKRVEEIDGLVTQQEQCNALLPVFENESNRMKQYLRQRNHQICKME